MTPESKKPTGRVLQVMASSSCGLRELAGPRVDSLRSASIRRCLGDLRMNRANQRVDGRFLEAFRPEAAPGELDPVLIDFHFEKEQPRLVAPADTHGHVG